MTIFKPATAYSDSIRRPDCPRCGTRMMLARLTLEQYNPERERRTFECPKCGNEVIDIVKLPPLS